MRPFIIGIGGAHSSSGKTTVGCRLLGRLKGWGAIKCTPTRLYSSVVDDGETLESRDKDTGRFLEAGAPEVLWVQSTPEDLRETLAMAVERLSRLEGIIVEGNSAIEVLRPDIVIFIFREPGRMKGGAPDILSLADIVIYDSGPPGEMPERACVFHREDFDGYLNHVLGVVGERKTHGAA